MQRTAVSIWFMPLITIMMTWGKRSQFCKQFLSGTMRHGEIEQDDPDIIRLQLIEHLATIGAFNDIGDIP